MKPLGLARQLKQVGIQTIIFTDIARDGAGTGINLASTTQLAQQSGLAVIASGGVNSYQDVLQVKNAGLPGVVVGKALYDQKINPTDLFKLQTGGA
jgi:phosphoribosylformimino-5-aminoimidazole carboxamide ribotide isomerase